MFGSIATQEVQSTENKTLVLCLGVLLTSREDITKLIPLSDSNTCMTQVYSMRVRPVLDPFMRQPSFCFSLFAQTAACSVVHKLHWWTWELEIKFSFPSCLSTCQLSLSLDRPHSRFLFLTLSLPLTFSGELVKWHLNVSTINFIPIPGSKLGSLGPIQIDPKSGFNLHHWVGLNEVLLPLHPVYHHLYKLVPIPQW